MSLWLPCGLHGFAVPNTVTVTVKVIIGLSKQTVSLLQPLHHSFCLTQVHAYSGNVSTSLAWHSSHMADRLWLCARGPAEDLVEWC
jgi:hypothetical protein